jgi:flotillin
MGGVQSAGPHQALALSGGWCSSSSRLVVGGWAWAWWGVTTVQTLGLGIRTLRPVCREAPTAEGVPLTCTGVAQVRLAAGSLLLQVKVFSDPAFLRLAMEQFLDVPEALVQATLQQTLEGHLRAILATLTVAEVNCNLGKFARQVAEVAAPDLARCH